MNERELLQNLSRRMPRSSLQVNGLFEADAEIIKWPDLRFAGSAADLRDGGCGRDSGRDNERDSGQNGDQSSNRGIRQDCGRDNDRGHLFVSVDEFSAEDRFLTGDPFALGQNIVCAALCDILAAGGRPLYYAHSLTVNEMFNRPYLERFYDGAAEVLRRAGADFIGGDFGRGTEWRCCTTVIGQGFRPVLRSGAKDGDHIYLTGPVGAGNIQAALGLYGPAAAFGGSLAAEAASLHFSLPLEAAADIRRHATSCIDTSDGLIHAAKTIARLSGVGFALENIPYLPAGRLLAKALGLPAEMLIFCECGEYQLLFTSPAELPYKKIGRITGGGGRGEGGEAPLPGAMPPGAMTLEGKDISGAEINARDYGDLKTYLKEVQRLCEGL